MVVFVTVTLKPASTAVTAYDEVILAPACKAVDLCVVLDIVIVIDEAVGEGL